MAGISFPFGLKREAEIYCTASKVGLSTEPNAPLAINGWADYFTQADICEASMQEVLDSVATVTRNAVEHLKDGGLAAPYNFVLENDEENSITNLIK